MNNPLPAGLQDGASKQESKMKDGVKDESGTVRQHKDTSTTSYITLADRGLDGTVRYTFEPCFSYFLFLVLSSCFSFFLLHFSLALQLTQVKSSSFVKVF